MNKPIPEAVKAVGEIVIAQQANRGQLLTLIISSACEEYAKRVNAELQKELDSVRLAVDTGVVQLQQQLSELGAEYDTISKVLYAAEGDDLATVVQTIIDQRDQLQKELVTSQRRLAEMLNLQMRTDNELVQLRADVKPLLEALRTCYDVTEWPAEKGSKQSKALEAFLSAHPEFKETP